MQDAQLISQAGLVESLASDGLVSVSTGAGQPQKNMELVKFADALGSSVPLQQNAEQVGITGLYARTSDGKMVELTKESVASVMAGLIGTATVSKDGLKSKNDFQNRNVPDKDINKATYNGAYEGIVSNAPDTSEYFLYIVINRGIYVYQIARGLNTRSEYTRCSIDSGSSWSPWKRIDNFGYNTLAELSSGVAEQMGAMTWLGLIDNFDTVEGSGFGYYTGDPNGFFLSISHKTNAEYKWQLRTVDNGSVLQVRTKSGTWTAWRNVSLT